MEEIWVGSRKDARDGWSARSCLFLIMLLVLALIEPTQGMAHQVPVVALSTVSQAVGELQSERTLEAKQPSDRNPLSLADRGIGCSLAGLDAPARGGTDHAMESVKVGRPPVRGPVLDVARAPPIPPPIPDLRLQTD